MKIKKIKENVVAEIVIKKSRFIAFLFNIKDEVDFSERYENIKKEHPAARHHTYAYIVSGKEKASDDGEPQGTAGKPMLESLKKHGLGGVAVVVVRYFGGILLGAGGLVRAYIESVKESIKNAEIESYEKCKVFTLSLSYENAAIIKMLESEKSVKKVATSYGEIIAVKLLVKAASENLFLNDIEKYNVKILEEGEVYERE